MHRDSKRFQMQEYYKRPYVDLRPDFDINIQKALFRVFCEFFDNPFNSAAESKGPRNLIQGGIPILRQGRQKGPCCGRHDDVAGSPAQAAKPALVKASTSRNIGRAEVNLDSPEIFLAQRRCLSMFFDWLKQIIEHCLNDDINPIRFSLAAQGAFLQLAAKERIDHGCEPAKCTDHVRRSVVKLYRAHKHQLGPSFQLLADHCGELATCLMEFLPTSGKDAGRIW